jgi:glycosyltransferase involved in cell wall biosynthesis
MSIDVEDSIDGFVKARERNEILFEAIERNEMLPFLSIYQNLVSSYFFFKKLIKPSYPDFLVVTYESNIYQNLVSSYFFFKKLIKTYNPDFLVVTQGPVLIPKSMAEKTIVYVHFPAPYDLNLPKIQRDYTSNIWKRLYIQPYLFISNNINYNKYEHINLEYIKKATIIANSNYTRNTIKKVWNIDSTVIYPPCPQYSFPLEDKIKTNTDTKSVCTLGRFVRQKEYEIILQIAKERPQLKFELIGGVTEDNISYLNRLKNKASKNVAFHVNATVNQKIEILKRSKILLHSLKGEHFGIALIEAMSAGLIPVSHNSGAAKEDNIVEEKFRYKDLDSALNCLDLAISEWNLDKASQLRQYAQNFSMENYNKNLKLFITNWIKSHSHLFKNK